jgi:hypothetical protein
VFELKLLVLGLFACVFLFLAGLIAPRRSKRIQAKLDRLLRRGERKSDRNAGKVGDLSRSSLKLVRRGSDKSAEQGRALRGKISRSA